MSDLPGYYMPHCTNCMASTHSVHNCPYNDEDDEGDDDADVAALAQARAEDDGERITLDKYLEADDVD